MSPGIPSPSTFFAAPGTLVALTLLYLLIHLTSVSPVNSTCKPAGTLPLPSPLSPQHPARHLAHRDRSTNTP